MEQWQITIGAQVIAAAATAGGLWFMARKDSRDVRTEFQRSIETFIDGRLIAMDAKIDGRLKAMDEKIDGRLKAMDAKFDGRLIAMDAKIDGLRNEVDDIKVRLNNIEAHLR